MQITLLNQGPRHGLMAIVCFTHEDLDDMRQAGGFSPIDLTQLFAQGIPLPGHIQFVCDVSQEAMDARLRASLPEALREAEEITLIDNLLRTDEDDQP